MDQFVLFMFASFIYIHAFQLKNNNNNNNNYKKVKVFWLQIALAKIFLRGRQNHKCEV